MRARVPGKLPRRARFFYPRPPQRITTRKSPDFRIGAFKNLQTWGILYVEGCDLTRAGRLPWPARFVSGDGESSREEGRERRGTSAGSGNPRKMVPARTIF